MLLDFGFLFLALVFAGYSVLVESRMGVRRGQVNIVAADAVWVWVEVGLNWQSLLNLDGRLVFTNL